MKQSSRNYIVFTALLLFLPWAAAAVDAFFPSFSSDSLLGGDDKLDAFSPSSLTVPPLPRECVVNAFKIFQPKGDDEMAISSTICEKMGPHHEKALAFALARCHLEDLGRSIIQKIVGIDIDDPQECTALALVDDDDAVIAEGENCFPNLCRCLSYLSDNGVHAYTIFLTHIMNLCNQLTQHLSIGIQQHTAMQLAKVSQEAVTQFNSILQHQHDVFNEREEVMRRRHEEFYESWIDQQEKLWEGQNSHIDEFKSMTSSMLENWKARDQEQREQYEAWLANQTALVSSRASVITTWFFQPFLIMDTLLSLVAQGYTLLIFLLHFFGVLYIAWLLTRPRFCQQFRGCLFAVIIMEGLAELCVYIMFQNDMVFDSQQKTMISSLRNAALGLEAAIYVGGLLLSCCGCVIGNREEEDMDSDSDSYDVNNSDQKEQQDVEDNNTPSREQHREQMQLEFRRLMEEAINRKAVTSSAGLPTSSGTLGVPPRFGESDRPFLSRVNAAEVPQQQSVLHGNPRLEQRMQGTKGSLRVATFSTYSSQGRLDPSSPLEAPFVLPRKADGTTPTNPTMTGATTTSNLEDHGTFTKAMNSPRENMKRSLDDIDDNDDDDDDDNESTSSSTASNAKRRRVETEHVIIDFGVGDKKETCPMDKDNQEEWADARSRAESDDDDNSTMEDNSSQDDGNSDDDMMTETKTDFV